jgi:hypothetical protein
MTPHYFDMLVVATLALGFPSLAMAQTITFADAATGSKPKDFEYGLTGGGSAVNWEIVADSTAVGGKALAQTSKDTTDYRFPLAIYTPTVLANVEVTVRFKPVAGSVDQAGGVVVRFADPNNYYVARANALEDNIRFYRVINGRRQQLGGSNGKIKSGEWRTLTLRAEGDNFTVSSEGQQLFTVSDKTFPGAGKVGLWTKADSVTNFDQIEINALP